MVTRLSIVVQAGGESRRMGQDKALLNFLGQPLISRVIDRLSPAGSEVVVTTNRPETLEFLAGVQRVPDLMPGMGALGGLYTALSAARHDLVAVVACDMPFASPRLITAFANLLADGDDDAVIAATAEGLEPLHAVYRRVTCLAAVRQALEQGEKRMISWHPLVKVRVIDESGWTALGASQLTFTNLNTPEELSQAEDLAREQPDL